MKTIKTFLEKRNKRRERELAVIDEECTICEKGKAVNHLAQLQKPNTAWVASTITAYIAARELHKGDFSNLEAMYIENIFSTICKIEETYNLHFINEFLKGILEADIRH